MKLCKLLILIFTGLLFLSIHGLAKAVEMNEAEKWFLQGNGYEQNNDLESAIEAYNKALIINSQYYDAYVRRGGVYKRKGNMEQALADSNIAIAINPTGTAAYFLRGAVYASTSNIKQALEDYSKIISVDPKNARAYVLRGYIYFNGRFAFSVIEKKESRELSEVQFIELSVKENLSRALSDFSRAIELDSDEAIIYELRAGVYSVLNDYDKAVADYNRAIGLTPRNIKLYEKRAMCHRIMKSWEKEWEDWNKIVELDSQNPDGYSMRAIVGKQLSKDVNQTIADLTKAIELSQSQEDKRSGLAALFRERGEVFRANGQKDEAITDFNAAIALKPNISDFYHSRGVVYLEIGDYDMAIDSCTRALELYDGSGSPGTYVVADSADFILVQSTGYGPDVGFLSAWKQTPGRKGIYKHFTGRVIHI
ncbi:MAG TPA: tetratricopeptide repeat protein [Ruminiclostridium sp.]|nr:tetratricopeptide repeat protein [Ruminiclostridium sp.]